MTRLDAAVPAIRLILAGILCFLLGVSLTRTSEDEKRHDRVQWLAQSMEEAQTIKVGMSKAELMKIFEPDGGLQPGGWSGRFSLRSCPFIMINVQFRPPDSSNPAPPDDKMLIAKVSEPYLEPPALD